MAFTLVAGLVVRPGTAFARAMDERAARALVRRYIDLHNRHRFAALMALYAPDATFQLSNGRGVVRGRAAIAELERFDIYADSSLQPDRLTFTRRKGTWRVDIGAVIENSAIFSALGMAIVRTQPVRDGFVLKEGQIMAVAQPDLLPACGRIAAAGFTGLVQWLQHTRDYRAPDLIADGKLELQPGRILILLAALADWRVATDWHPNGGDVSACATGGGRA